MLEKRVEELQREVEQVRMQLVACGIAALGNTENGLLQRLEPGHSYYSASYKDVCNAVDREMRYRRLLELLAPGVKDEMLLGNLSDEEAARRIRAYVKGETP